MKSSVKNLDRYLPHFVGSNYLVFVPVDGYSHSMDSDQPYVNIAPSSGVRCQSIATYPVDGEFIIFGFKAWREAATFALKAGTEVVEVDVNKNEALRRANDVAYAIWYWRRNDPKHTWVAHCDNVLGSRREFLANITVEEFDASNRTVNMKWPSTP